MKILNLLFALLFIVLAAWEYDDPNPHIWVPIYLYGTLVCTLFALGKFNIWLLIVGMIFYSALIIFLLFDNNGVLSLNTKFSERRSEDTKDLFGLLTLMIVFLTDLFLGTRNQKKTSIGVKQGFLL